MTFGLAIRAAGLSRRQREAPFSSSATQRDREGELLAARRRERRADLGRRVSELDFLVSIGPRRFS